MSSRKTRDRQLAKLAARRAAERKKKRRQRALTVGIAALVAIIGLGTLGFVLSNSRSKTNPQASGTPTPSPTTTVPAVACGASVPATASQKKPHLKKAPPVTIDTSKSYTATLKTSCGTFTIRLFADKSPITVNNFVFLSQKGYYNGTIIHRIAVNPAVIQGGDPTGTGSGGPGYTIKDELKNGLTFKIGTVAMANTGQPDSGGSQFFIVTGKTGTQLPNQYSIFGEVVQGMDVVMRIYALPVQGETPKEKIYIEKVTIKAT